jgi:hypothetical protein
MWNNFRIFLTSSFVWVRLSYKLLYEPCCNTTENLLLPLFEKHYSQTALKVPKAIQFYWFLITFKFPYQSYETLLKHFLFIQHLIFFSGPKETLHRTWRLLSTSTKHWQLFFRTWEIGNSFLISFFLSFFVW